MDFSDRIRRQQALTVYAGLALRSSTLGSNCQLSNTSTGVCSSSGCKVNFLTYSMREDVRQGRAVCTGNSNFLAAYVGPTLTSNYTF